MFSSNVFASVLLCSLFLKCASEKDIYVSPDGNDSSNCSASFKCKTLDRALGLARGLNSTRILLSKGNYSLNTSHSFTKIASFGLLGNTSYDHDVQISCQIACEPNVSLSFTFSENISVEGVKFRKCGGWHPSSAGMNEQYAYFKGAKFKTALDFRYCRNLRISNVEICSSPGLGANLYDVGGVVNFTNSLFADNYALNESSYDRWIFISPDGSYVYSGGGVNLMLNQYSHNMWNVTPGEHDSYQHNNIYEFSNCHFMRNRAMWLNDTKDDNGMNTLKLPFNRGGGLAMYFQGNASGCHIKIQSCVFANNKASWGGGFQVEMKDKTENNSLEVRATVFRENFASFAGGGARLGSLPEKHVQLRINRFEMTNCSFVSNRARLGGGASLYGATIPRMCTNHTDPVVTQFFFKNDCSWIGNIGAVGAAVSAFLINRNEDLIGPEIPYRVCFENTVFRSNKVVSLHHNLVIGQGTFYSQQVPLIFRGNVQFVSNNQSALVLDGSIVEVIDRLDFLNNTGVRGGAIAMYGRSRILLHENTSVLKFEGNNCEDKGGALYIQAPGPPLVSFNATGVDNQVCFFGYSKPAKDYDEWNTTVIFKNNSASLGTSVFATTLQYCRRPGENRQRNSVLKWKFITFDDLPSNSNTSLLGKVVTEPVNITTDKKEWEVAPGEHFDAFVKLCDEVGNVVSGIVNVSIESAQSVKLSNPSRSLFLSTEGRITNITLHGENGSNFDVKLNYIGSQLLKKKIRNVTLKNCYDGFYYCNDTSMCKCMSKTNKITAKGISRCENGNSVYIKEGYWAGKVAGKFVTYFCPPGYCNSPKHSVYKYSEGHMCIDSRKQNSTLCGQCKHNYTITFGSELCFKSCSYWHLLSMLPIGFGFLLVVVIVMLVDLDFFTGYLNAWLYSYQIMDLLTPDEFRFDPFIEFITAFTNVHIEIGGRSFCLASGLDDADKLMLMYGIPVYVLIVVAILTWLVGRYPRWCFSRKVLRSSPSAPFRAVCTILVFCYTDITRISLLILSPAHVGSKTVLYFYGNLDFFHKKHIAYGIVAILWIVIFVLPFPLILLFRPYLTRGLRPVLNLNRWGPFFDAFQSCFKNQYRWCASFYFLCRLGILLMHTYIPSSSVKRVVLEGACILILVIFAYLRPYKEARDVNEGESSYEWIYKSDVALLTTLALITVISSKIDCSCFTTKDEKKGLKVAVCVLAYVPLIVLLVLGYRVLRTYCPAIDIGNCVTEEEAITPIVTETSDSACSGRRGTSEPTTSPENSLVRSPRTRRPKTV